MGLHSDASGLCKPIDHKNKYSEHKRLGPMKIPSQKTRFLSANTVSDDGIRSRHIGILEITYPKTSFPFKNLVLDSMTKGSCNICNANKYPLTLPKMTAITSSCTQALRKNVRRVAVDRESRRVVIDEW
jgi:hypothetical protein